ncbi:hypothetical protein M0805_007167 [Coniferiporia weirii]|nr:hypothetical protein M0805_007167 [Coniferiporia weirii]
MSDTHSEPDATHHTRLNSLASQPGPSSPGGRGPRQTRIHFPADAESSVSNASGSPITAGIGLRSLEAKQLRAPPALGMSPDDEFFAEHRRVRSVNVQEVPQYNGPFSRTQFVSGQSRQGASSRRAVSYSLSSPDRSIRGGTTSLGSSPLSGRALLPPDEDVSVEDDPNILADLRKALQYKARVEQHLKEVKSGSEIPLLPTREAAPLNSSPSPFLPKSPTLGRSEPTTPLTADFVDFSPSAGKAKMHPVPTSADEGATLDWSGSSLEEEKRERKWSMSISRRSSKDKYPILSRKGLVEKQASLYYDKLTSIRDKANPHTLRKAEITREQLRRRYAVLNASLAPDAIRLNLVDVARWLSTQENDIKLLLRNAEPMSWLRHLQKRTDNQLQQSSRILSAMIIDEYVRSDSRAGFTHPLSQNSSMVDIASETSSSVSVAHKARRSVSRPTSFHSVDYASMRRKSDDLISFEPIVHSRRDSVGTDSRISVDTQLRRWRHSLTGKVNADTSPQSSLKSRPRNESLELPNAKGSPVNTRSPLQNFGAKKRGRSTPQNSDDGHSSAVDSIMEGYKGHEGDNANKRQGHERKKSRFHLPHQKAAHASVDEMKLSSAPLSITDLRTDARPAKGFGLAAEDDAETSIEAIESFLPSKRQLSSPIVLNSVRGSSDRKKKVARLSLPAAFQTPHAKRVKSDKRTEPQDHALRIEYIRKKETLDALIARNTRMKLLLQTASRSVAEYDDTQCTMSEKLGLVYRRLPRDALQAFSHDPAGKMSELKGWRGVEEVFLRRKRQKDIFEMFTASISDTVTPLRLPKDGLYKDVSDSLTELVERLHSQRSTVLSQVRQSNELLIRVKRMRDELKPEFDAASKYTSANYSELVELETQLDEFVNRKNRLWKLGEASLSFILTSVAPLMKTFGRPVWNELHDFLVIPFYRNGFSGEDHWYPVSFPKRDPTDWLRLLLLAGGAPFCLLQGTRFFVDLLTKDYLSRIPSFVPSIVVYLSYSGVICAFTSLIMVLLIAVLCECFIVLWWTAWILHIVA